MVRNAPVPAVPAPGGWADYARALDRVSAHIEEHLHQPLDLAQLAEVACLSPCHFHRVYHAMRGETLAATVRRVRLQRAAWWLVRSELDVDTVARRCGFSGASAFTRVFRQHHGITPAAYRRSGPHQAFRAGASATPAQPGGALHVAVRDVPARTLPAGPCAVLRYQGPYASMHAAYRWLFGQWLPQSGQAPGTHPVYEHYLNDPRQVPPAELLTDIHLPLAPLQASAG